MTVLLALLLVLYRKDVIEDVRVLLPVTVAFGQGVVIIDVGVNNELIRVVLTEVVVLTVVLIEVKLNMIPLVLVGITVVSVGNGSSSGQGEGICIKTLVVVIGGGVDAGEVKGGKVSEISLLPVEVLDGVGIGKLRVISLLPVEVGIHDTIETVFVKILN